MKRIYFKGQNLVALNAKQMNKETGKTTASKAGKLLPLLGTRGKKLRFLGDILISDLASITGSVLSQAPRKKLVGLGMR